MSKEQLLLFSDDEIVFEDKKLFFNRLRNRIWTENKAKLIERYLYYFVLITKHGNYIDGFAGPQDPGKPETWAAKLVLETNPRWLRNFFLFEKDTNQFKFIEQLRDSQPNTTVDERKRKIYTYQGDFNILIDDLLDSGLIKRNEATFCLLDQRTFECHWNSLQKLAGYKSTDMKIELFYFLANGWFDRSICSIKNSDKINSWWGKDDWAQLIDMKHTERAEFICERFRKELGYKYVNPWPIYEKNEGGRIMYYMIHATDHDEAPKLMRRAYGVSVYKFPLEVQTDFGF